MKGIAYSKLLFRFVYQITSTPKKMENLITKNQEALSTVETKHLQKRYDFVNEQLIIDQFRRHLDSIKRSEYQEDWFDIQMILQQRNNLTK